MVEQAGCHPDAAPQELLAAPGIYLTFIMVMDKRC